MFLKTIPNEVQCLLNASARVNNFKRAIEELVYNSLDAESNSIAIRVHIQKNWIQVVDNGIGIKNVDFNLLGERYATSKFLDVDSLKAAPSKYGYRGQALANIIEVSQTVKIISRHINSDETWVKTFCVGKEQEILKTVNRPSKGTTVEINGFLFNLKIQKQSINLLNELQDVKLFLEQLSLLFNNISISLRDDSESEIIFKIHKNRDIYQTLNSIFDITAADVKELQVEKNEYRVKAYIGKSKNDRKKYQWIYINNKFIYNCNLHKLVNIKLSKAKNFVDMKSNKIRNKAIYNEENQVESRSDELYFLFISCPYYDYDIVYSGRQTTVEFKDWEQINKLIVKLVQFYNGDLSLLNVQKNNSNINVVAKSTVDTRSEVKKIIEKVLGKHNKTSKISQVQKAIKGRQIKRKKKKEPLKHTLKKPTRSLNSLKLSDNNMTLQNDDLTKSPLKNCNAKMLLKSKKEKNKFEYKAKKKSSNNLKRAVKCKCYQKRDNLLEIFRNHPDTSKKIINELSNCTKKFSNIYSYNKNDEKSYKNQFINKIKDTKNKEEKLRVIPRQANISVDQQFLKHPDINFLSYSYSKKSSIEKVTSHDLLHTILKTQAGHSSDNLVKKDKHVNVQRSNIYQTRGTSSTFQPTFTFQSHKYRIQETLQHKNRTKKQKFISNQSRENFIHNRDNNKNERKLPIRNNSYNQCILKNKRNVHNKVVHKYKQGLLDTEFSIDISESDILEYSKKIRNQIITDANYLLNTQYNQSKSLSRPQCTEKVNFEINFNIASTYTILQDSFQDHPQFQQMPNKNYSCVNETVIKDYNIRQSCYDETAIETKPIAKKNNNFKKNYSVYVSETQETNNMDTIIEPLEICDAVINNGNEADVEFDNVLNIYSKKNNLLTMEKSDVNNIKIFQNITPHSQIIVSQDKNRHLEDFQATSSINPFETKPNSPNKDEQNLGKVINTEEYNNSVGNFNLLGRHRFMPKGMSPIFKNCFSKNICSYNLDAEYYDDVIYDNFFEDVVENTEMYEPHVQATKEIATRPIQKVADNIRKDNDNLTFGTESLVAAQVVLGQVDNKFIAAKIRGKSQTHESLEFLVLFDQHAVHERIRLENNLSHYFNGNNWKNVTIDAISLKVCREEMLYLHNHNDKFQQFGLEWTVLNNSEIMVNRIPEAIVGRNPRPMEAIMQTVKNLISEQVHALKHLKGNVNFYPQSIMNLVFNEACRYAIKFGDILSKSDCSELIAALASCKTPFQCAHGRPVMAVIMELECDSDEYKVNAQNMLRFKNNNN